MMRTKRPDVEDLTQVAEETRTHVIDVELTDEVRAALQAEADKRGVTLEDYLRWQAFTAASVSEAEASEKDDAATTNDDAN